MVWVWRVCLGLLIAAYAAWLVLPLLQPLVSGGSLNEAIAAVQAESASLGAFLPSLWLSAAVLYLAAAIMTVARIGAAPGAYFLAFGCELIQRVFLQETRDAGIANTPQRVAETLHALGLTLEPGPAVLSALLIIGLLVLMSGVWRGAKGQALTRHWTEPPAYA